MHSMAVGERVVKVLKVSYFVRKLKKILFDNCMIKFDYTNPLLPLRGN